MGRQRKPVELRLLDGTYKPSRHGPRPDDLGEVKPPAKPRDLPADAARFWTQLVRLLKGVVREHDAPQLVELCLWWARAQRAGKKLDTMEPGTAAYGRLQRQAKDAAQQFDQIAKRFGMTPADRAQLRAEQAGPAKAKAPTRPKGLL